MRGRRISSHLPPMMDHAGTGDMSENNKGLGLTTQTLEVMRRLAGYGIYDSVMVTDSITTSVTGRSPGPVGTFSMASTTSRPETTLPNSE